jgi:FkbM family methyltransferase
MSASPGWAGFENRVQYPMTTETPAFGQFAPSPLIEGLMERTRRCDKSWLGKRKAFLLRGLAIRALKGQPVDTQSLGAKMRLYPYNNVCEKRILFTPQYFDEAERQLLASRITPDFVFLDIGANIGGYTLFVAALAGPRARLLAIEPQPEIFERLIYNVRLNDFSNVKALNCAVADVEGEITLFVAHGNKGETSMRIVNADSRGDQIKVPAQTLSSIVAQEGFTHIDAVKLDVEGAEDLILEPFFREAPEHLRPKLVLMEFSHGRWAADLNKILLDCGYREVLRTKTNVAYERQ